MLKNYYFINNYYLKKFNYREDVNNNGIIYLTFDDGPSKYTSKILDILKKYNIKATFFVTGNGEDNLIKREYDEGHTVALHSFSHDYSKIYSSTIEFFKDLEKIQDRVYKITGEKSMILRFPGGSFNTISKKYNDGIMSELIKEVSARGYHYFDWNADSEDTGTCSMKENNLEKKNCIIDNFIKEISPSKRNFVLLHDIKSYTADALEYMIKYALLNGYTFEKISMNTKELH